MRDLMRRRAPHPPALCAGPSLSRRERVTRQGLRILILCALVLVILAPFATWASGRDDFSMRSFRQIPLLHDGRIKPLDSFAALTLRRVSDGKSGLDPDLWLAEMLFDPQAAAARRVFAIGHPEVPPLLNLPPETARLYSLQEIAPGLAATETQAITLAQADPDSLTPGQKALVLLHENALTVAQLLKALSPLLPLQATLPATLGPLPEDRVFSEGPTWLELKKSERELTDRVRRIIDAKGEALDRYTDEEKTIAALAFEMQVLQQSGAGNALFRVIPPVWQDGAEWLSPWALLQTGQGSPQGARALADWQAMAKAWRGGNAAAWEAASAAALDQARSQLASPYRLRLEVVYNGLHPFRAVMGLYLLSLLAVVFYAVRKRGRGVAVVCALGAFGLHAAGLMLRIAILGRPPVGSLYESLLFVSLVVIGSALVLEARRRDGLALGGGVVAALGILLAAPVTAPDGDSLETLVAVLNTNFWLATHVICVTAGYGLCILAAMLAHVFLFRQGPQDGMSRSLYLLSLSALLFTAVGTVLGGIWADQSWGRFWGWDPKENGALLIVLWLIWLHHGRHGGFLDTPAFCAGLACLNIVVALAWFGVNLLGVGLHSYGFTSGMAAGLALFCAAEILSIGWLWRRAVRAKGVSRAA